MKADRVGVACMLVGSWACTCQAGVVSPGFFGLRGPQGATGVSDSGLALLSGSSTNYLWTVEGGLRPITGVVGAYRMSADGTTIAGTGPGGPFKAVVTSSGAVLSQTALPQIPGTNTFNLDIGGLSADGSVVVGTGSNPVTAFRHTQATGSVGLAMPSGIARSRGVGVSPDGKSVAGRADSRPFLYTLGGMAQVFEPFMGESGEFRAFSGDGRVVLGHSESGSGGAFTGVPFTWTQSGGFTSLGTLPPLPTGGDQRHYANAANLDGTLIAGTQADRVAWVWDAAHGIRNLQSVLETEYGFDLAGWRLTSVEDVSADGRFLVGHALYTAGGVDESASFVAIIPAPSMATSLLAVGLFASRRRR